jgi:hypothetical protein
MRVNTARKDTTWKPSGAVETQVDEKRQKLA